MSCDYQAIVFVNFLKWSSAPPYSNVTFSKYQRGREDFVEFMEISLLNWFLIPPSLNFSKLEILFIAVQFPCVSLFNIFWKLPLFTLGLQLSQKCIELSIALQLQLWQISHPKCHQKPIMKEVTGAAVKMVVPGTVLCLRPSIIIELSQKSIRRTTKPEIN